MTTLDSPSGLPAGLATTCVTRLPLAIAPGSKANEFAGNPLLQRLKESVDLADTETSLARYSTARKAMFQGEFFSGLSAHEQELLSHDPEALTQLDARIDALTQQKDVTANSPAQISWLSRVSNNYRQNVTTAHIPRFSVGSFCI